MTSQPELAKLRKLFIEPGAVTLATDDVNQRWLTDQFVIIDVTDLRLTEPDGRYRLMTSELRSLDQASHDVTAYLTKVEYGAVWEKVIPTGWSVTADPAKAALVYVTATRALAINEALMLEFLRQYPEGYFEHDVTVREKISRRVFRFGTDAKVIAYVAGIAIPPEHLATAKAIVRRCFNDYQG
jgi:hypothetical protein